MPIERGDSSFSPKCIEVQPWIVAAGGRALLLCGGFTAYQATANSECQLASTTSETAGANMRRQEGNNPDRQLRPPSNRSVGKVVAPRRQPGGWLRSSHP
jgi:hypothetical protein